MKALSPEAPKQPVVYAIEQEGKPGVLKIGYARDVHARLKSLLGGVNTPFAPDLRIVWKAIAKRKDNTSFRDAQLHEELTKAGIKRLRSSDGESTTEYFECGISDVEKAYRKVTTGEHHSLEKMPALRREQEWAINLARKYFTGRERGRFLWNAKMRFGKTLAAYSLCQRMGTKKIIVVTFKPAVGSAWQHDLDYTAFNGWKLVQAIKPDAESSFRSGGATRVLFISFQDLLGRNSEGAGKDKNRWIFDVDWDMAIFDEYHFGAWREKSQELFEHDFHPQATDVDSITKRISSANYLYMSGTPFRSLANGEFLEDQIFNWTYLDEQNEKERFSDSGGKENPYAMMPKMYMLSYSPPQELIGKIAVNEEGVEFNLNSFFKADPDTKAFVNESDVMSWLNAINGTVSVSTLKNSPNNDMPFANSKLMRYLLHTFWLLPNVASCDAMEKLLNDHPFYSNYKIINVSGAKAGMGEKSFEFFRNRLPSDPEKGSITLSCGKLTTGITVKQWTGVFMLRDLDAAETYFQTIFRAQSPWVEVDEYGETHIEKHHCYAIDFSTNRTLAMLVEYARGVSPSNAKTQKLEEAVADLRRVMPIIALQGNRLVELNTDDIVGLATWGISSTALARRFKSADLINFSGTLANTILSDEKILGILSKITAFRDVKSDIQKVIVATENVNKAVSRIDRFGRSVERDNDLDAAKKERNRRRADFMKKMLKFVSKLPIFMYLTDFRESALVDVIRTKDPVLFEKISEITVDDFNDLKNAGLFNAALLDTAILNFRRVEEPSLSYLGFTAGSTGVVGGFDTVIDKSTGKRYRQ